MPESREKLIESGIEMLESEEYETALTHFLDACVMVESYDVKFLIINTLKRKINTMKKMIEPNIQEIEEAVQSRNAHISDFKSMYENLSKDDIEAKFELAQMYYALGKEKYEEVIEVAKREDFKDSKNDLLEAEKIYSGAIDFLNITKQLDSGNIMVNTYLEEMHYDRAITRLRLKDIKRKSRSEDIEINFKCRDIKADLEEARKFFVVDEEFDRLNFETGIEIFDSIQDRRNSETRYKEAKECFDKVLKEDPWNIEARWRRIRTESILGGTADLLKIPYFAILKGLNEIAVEKPRQITETIISKTNRKTFLITGLIVAVIGVISIVLELWPIALALALLTIGSSFIAMGVKDEFKKTELNFKRDYKKLEIGSLSKGIEICEKLVYEIEQCVGKQSQENTFLKEIEILKERNSKIKSDIEGVINKVREVSFDRNLLIEIREKILRIERNIFENKLNIEKLGCEINTFVHNLVTDKIKNRVAKIQQELNEIKSRYLIDVDTLAEIEEQIKKLDYGNIKRQFCKCNNLNDKVSTANRILGEITKSENKVRALKDRMPSGGGQNFINKSSPGSASGRNFPTKEQ